ncbi:hypothetical protein, partial [Shinella sumterensis]|uniref:hypothetical protein n=1 Tax=Shinella sumterensis TaxID=1967501 RepID=UPI003F83BCBA
VRVRRVHEKSVLSAAIHDGNDFCFNAKRLAQFDDRTVTVNRRRWKRLLAGTESGFSSRLPVFPKIGGRL